MHALDYSSSMLAYNVASLPSEISYTHTSSSEILLNRVVKQLMYGDTIYFNYAN